MRYKKPSPVNGVSIVLLLLAALLGYVGYSTWPIVQRNANVKNELAEALPLVYKANLAPEPVASERIAELRQRVVAAIEKLGVKDPNGRLTIERNSKQVTLVYSYRATIRWVGLERTDVVDLHPTVRTDASRVEW